MTNKLKKYFEELIQKPFLTSFIVFVLLAILILGLSWHYYVNDFDNIYLNVLAEAHGMLFDILIIGILIYWLREVGEEKQRVRQYIDEIDDFRMWESEEAAFRNVGNIKRLNRHGVNNIELVGCYLKKTNLSGVNLKSSNLNTANLSNAILIEANLSETRMNQTNFENSNLNHAILKGTYASGSNFKDAFMIKANLEGAFLIKADFQNGFLMEANLSNCSLAECNFENANLYKANFVGATGLTIDQLSKAKSLYLATFDPDMKVQLEEHIPDLIG
ncbi:MAG: pentapeptide repeat-containing protein [Cyclobacteriaceae bacterium]|nr:pentapeptide repeat-containing protein [Cyclobacteriaceae bacterium]